MAVAAPARRLQSQAATAPARSAPPEPKKRPRDRPRPGGQRRSAGTATARTATPARRTAPKRRAPGRVIPIAAGAAVAVTQLPESGLIHRLTRGRAWIGVLGVLLIGIVALNVVTLSFAASAGKVDARIQELSRENSVLQTLQAKKYGQARIHYEAKELGLATSTAAEPTIVTVGGGNFGTAAKRLAAAVAGTAAATFGSEATASAGEATGSGEETPAGEEFMSAEEAAAVNLEGLSQEEKNAIYEETLAREAVEAESVTEVPTE